MNSLIYNAGTVSVSGGSAIVEGNLTGWGVALVEGGVFSCDGLSIPILSVEDDTHLTLAYAWSGANGSGKEYAIARTPSEATARAATWTVDRLGKLAQTPWGVGVVPDGRGTLAQRNALNPMPNDDYCWLRVEVDQPLEYYFREGGVWLGPYVLEGEGGETGPANTLTIGTVQGGASADASITGSAPSQTLNLVLPKGDQGDKGDTGDTGPSGTITGATASGLAAGAAPTVTLGGTPQARTFAFGIPKGDKGDTGDTGPSGTITGATASGLAAGASPTVSLGGTPQARTFAFGIPKGDKGDKGDTGDDGWTPVFAVVADGARYVQQVIDWTGGTGTKPATGQYVGPSGLVSAIGDAVNIRGASGSGTGDMLASVYDPANKAGDAFAMDNMVEGADTKIMTAAERAAISDNTAARHTHSNKAILDGTQQSFTTALKNKLDGIETGADKTPDLSGLATTAQLTAGLSGKFDNPTGTTSQYIRGDGSLAAFPSIPAGTVTSVGLSAPTGFSVSGSPVSGAGTLTFAYASGYTGFTTALQTKLNGIEAGAQVNTVTSVAGKTGAVTLAKGDVGLGNVDDTSDANKPVSSAQAAAINAKVTKANDTGLGGFTATSKALPTSGTINLAPTDGNIQHCAKTGAVTMNAPTAAGVYTIIVEVHNTNATGTVTLAGFTKTDGDAFTTTNGHKFLLHVAKTNSAVTATVKALQ